MDYFESFLNTKNPKMLEILQKVERLKDSNVPILILGESGTGKELLSQYIYNSSNRNKKSYNVINCAAIPKDLIESELFGHIKGSFTGAYTSRIGIIGKANLGTLLFDEIGDLILDAQSKLLRVLQEKKFKKVGGNVELFSDFRIISATNKDLINSNDFRKDLYYRISTVKLQIPSLRERKEDIENLVNFYLIKFSKEFNIDVPKLDKSDLYRFLNYDWPGNIRELSNVICESILLSKKTFNVSIEFKENLENNYDLEENERRLIIKALEDSNWIQLKACKLLGISLRALGYKLKRHNLYNLWSEKKNEIQT